MITETEFKGWVSYTAWAVAILAAVVNPSWTALWPAGLAAAITLIVYIGYNK